MRQRTFNGYSETDWQKASGQGCGVSIILPVSGVKGHPAAVAVDREVIAIQS
jgi:hypothetical protein